jgi:DNA mismatch repair protein MSH2
MEKELFDAARQLGLEANKSIKLEHANHLNHFFRMTLKEEKVLRGNKSFQVPQKNMQLDLINVSLNA